MLREARTHTIFRQLTTCPGIGPVRVAQLLPIVITPYRFRSKRSFWGVRGAGDRHAQLLGLGAGQWVRAETQQTRGLTRRYTHRRKQIFKGAATTIIGRARPDDPLFQHYQRLLDGGHEAEPGQAHHRPAGRVDHAVDVEVERHLRSPTVEDDIARLRMG